VNDQIEQGKVGALTHEMGLNEGSLERRKKMVGLDPSDLARIATIKDIVIHHADDYTAAFFEHLSGLEEAGSLMGSKVLVDRAKQLKREHIVAMVDGDYGVKYAQERLELASLYATAGLDTGAFLGAFHHMLKNMGIDIMKQSERTPLDGLDKFMSLKKIAFIDIGLIVDVLVLERERIIRQQAEAIRELSTPVLQVRERMLLCPIIGVIDTLRARLITESLLKAIRANRAKVVVMDVTGVATIDSRVANHILQTVTAARLMGAQVIVTGLSSEVAQSLAALGIDLARLNFVGDLQGGLEAAEQLLGYRVVLSGDGVSPARTAS
jgi:rsbT co-antagonist protein RsbR